MSRYQGTNEGLFSGFTKSSSSVHRDQVNALDPQDEMTCRFSPETKRHVRAVLDTITAQHMRIIIIIIIIIARLVGDFPTIADLLTNRRQRI